MTKTFTLTVRYGGKHGGGGKVEEHDAESISDFLDSLKRAVDQNILVPGETFTIKVKEEEVITSNQYPYVGTRADFNRA